MPDRKPHIKVEQHYYLDYITEHGPQTAQDLAAIFDVSVTTAKFKLAGLVYQGKLVPRSDFLGPQGGDTYHLKD